MPSRRRSPRNTGHRHGGSHPPPATIAASRHVPLRPHAARDRGCGRCNSEDRRQQVGIFSKFRQVSEITKDRRIIPGSVSGSVSGCRSDHIRSILQSPPNTGGRLRSGGALTGCVPGVSRSDHIRSIRSGPHRPEGCESCTGRDAAPFFIGFGHLSKSDKVVRELHGSGRCTLPFRGGTIEGRPAGGGPGFFRDGRHVSG